MASNVRLKVRTMPGFDPAGKSATPAESTAHPRQRAWRRGVLPDNRRVCGWMQMESSHVDSQIGFGNCIGSRRTRDHVFDAGFGRRCGRGQYWSSAVRTSAVTRGARRGTSRSRLDSRLLALGWRALRLGRRLLDTSARGLPLVSAALDRMRTALVLPPRLLGSLISHWRDGGLAFAVAQQKRFGLPFCGGIHRFERVEGAGNQRGDRDAVAIEDARSGERG